MPWTTHIDPGVNCVFNKFYGAFEIEQIMGAVSNATSSSLLRVPDILGMGCPIWGAQQRSRTGRQN